MIPKMEKEEIVVWFPHMKGPRREGSGLKKEKEGKKKKKTLPSKTFFSFSLIFFRPKYCQHQIILPSIFSLKQHFLVENFFCQNIMTNSIQWLLLLWRPSPGYKQRIKNNIFSAKLLLAYPAKELVKSLLPRAFTCQAGGAGKSEVGIATFSSQIESLREILNLLTNSYF